jgi:DNA-binding MarR family transcriptional regulator
VERFDVFTVLIAKISRKIRKIKSQEMAKFNLKSPHVSCLYYLYKYGSMTARELCDFCDEDKAAISRSLVFLEKSGYVSAPAALKKRYKTVLALTESGKEVGEFIVKKIDAVLDLVDEGLSAEHREILYKSLSLIDNNLEAISKCELK